MKKLLHRDPLKRLGVKDKNEIKCHTFFKDINFDRLLKKESDPPFDIIELGEEILKPDRSLKFNDDDYQDKNDNQFRVADFSFAQDND